MMPGSASACRQGARARGAVRRVAASIPVPRGSVLQTDASSALRSPGQAARRGGGGQYVVVSFDNIDHHALMVRLRRRVGDPKVSRLVWAFLKSGILSEQQFTRSEAGTPQGGILSPLLANIALGVLDERYVS